MRLMFCLVLSAAVCVAGCASTDVTGFRDPAFRDAAYSDIVVMSRSDDLIRDKAVEDRFVQCLSRYKVRARPSTDIFPPTRETTQQEVLKKLAEEGTAALLLINFESQWTDTYFREGTSKSVPRAKYAVELIDTKSGAVVWKASTFTAGDEFSDTGVMLSSLASKTTGALVKEGLVGLAEDKADR